MNYLKYDASGCVGVAKLPLEQNAPDVTGSSRIVDQRSGQRLTP